MRAFLMFIYLFTSLSAVAQVQTKKRIDTVISKNIILKVITENPTPIKEKKELTLTDIVSIIASLSTLITVIFTYILLRETQKTLKISIQTAKREENRLGSEMVGKVYENFKNTYREMISEKDGLEILSKAHENIPKVRLKENMYSSFLINNVHEIFILRQKGFIDDPIWEHYLIDIKDFFQLTFIVKRWSSISNLYPHDFNKFVEGL